MNSELYWIKTEIGDAISSRRRRIAARNVWATVCAAARIEQENEDIAGDALAHVLRSFRNLIAGLFVLNAWVGTPIMVLFTLWPLLPIGGPWHPHFGREQVQAAILIAVSFVAATLAAFAVFKIADFPYRLRRNALRRRRGLGPFPRLRQLPKRGWDPAAGPPPPGFPEIADQVYRNGGIVRALPDDAAGYEVAAQEVAPAPEPSAEAAPQDKRLGDIGPMMSTHAIAQRMFGPLKWRYEVRLGNGSKYVVDDAEVKKIRAARDAGATLITVTTLDMNVGNVDVNVHGIAEIVRCPPSDLEILNRLDWPMPPAKSE